MNNPTDHRPDDTIKVINPDTGEKVEVKIETINEDDGVFTYTLPNGDKKWDYLDQIIHNSTALWR